MAVDDERPVGNIQNLIDSTTLRWIFVGGKGGVGKTTTSCSLATALSHHRPSVLLISTDPAHNLSDAFGQRFSKHPALVNGFTNLYAMEVDPTVEVEPSALLSDASSALFSELASSIPGIDEAVAFAELLKLISDMQYSTIVFDTAPTGHTLRLLSLPSVLDRALGRLLALRSRFSALFGQVSALTGIAATEDSVVARLEATKATVDRINAQFKDAAATTFVCVLIPEFLSLYETERLVQELAESAAQLAAQRIALLPFDLRSSADDFRVPRCVGIGYGRYEIDVCNVVVNQINVLEKGSQCRKCRARGRMQGKYLAQVDELYEDMHVIKMPLLDEEVRGKERIEQFAAWLMRPEDAWRVAEEGGGDGSSSHATQQLARNEGDNAAIGT